MSIDTSKIIHAPVGGGRYTVTAPIVKEDYGLYLKIEGLELPSTYEVDFSNSEHNGTSVTMIGNSDGVLIPSQFISSGKDVFAFLYHVGSDYGRTVYKFRIPNKLRPDRTDEEPTPEEQSTIDQAISALNSAVSATAQDVIDADASAQSASQSAENAHDSAADAQNYAESASGYASDAQGYANTASQKATEASNSADQAAQIKTDIEGYVSTAQGYAQTATDKAAQASQSATNASNSATTASTKAGEASASATTASNKASEASGYATTASNKATEASGYASTASQKASDASDSASAALGYKTDAESAKVAAQTAQGKAETAQGKAEDAAESVSASAAQIATNTADIADLQTDVAQNEADILKAFPTDSASGSIASFSDGADDIPLKSLIVDINPVQDLSQGDPSPENLCPISGWTEVDVEQRGVNVWDEEWEVGAYSYATGEKAVASDRIRTKNFISVKPNTSYYFKGDGNSAKVLFYDASHGFIETWSGNSWLTTNREFTTPSNCCYICFATASAYGATYNHDISINYPSTDHDYHPYTGQTIPISWQTEAGTVYGGKLDVLSGVMTIFTAKKIVTSFTGMFAIGTANNGNAFYKVFDNATHSVPASFYKLMASNIFTYFRGSRGSAPLYSYGGNDGVFATYMFILPKTITTVDDANAWLSNLDTPLEVTAFLATPIEIQLTPHEVNSLLGQNNIFADTGDTEVEYRADTKLYIERLTAPDADMIADANIVSGQYFMVGNNLYKATANIASGAQVIVGTNAIRKSLSEALNEINS